MTENFFKAILYRRKKPFNDDVDKKLNDIMKHGKYEGYYHSEVFNQYLLFKLGKTVYAIRYVDNFNYKEYIEGIYIFNEKEKEKGKIIERELFLSDFSPSKFMIIKFFNYLKRKNIQTGVAALIKNEFKNKKDKCGVEYWKHCEFVANKSVELAKKYYADEDFQQICYYAGWFHDYLEDIKDSTKESLRDNILRCYIAPETANIVSCIVDVLTKKEGLSEEDYYSNIKNNYASLIVKAADTLHNSDYMRYDYLTKDILEKSFSYYLKHRSLINVLDDMRLKDFVNVIEDIISHNIKEKSKNYLMKGENNE